MGTVVERTREDILDDLADRRHDAGRMTISDARYEPLHDAINDLLTELETCGKCE